MVHSVTEVIGLLIEGVGPEILGFYHRAREVGVHSTTRPPRQMEQILFD